MASVALAAQAAAQPTVLPVNLGSSETFAVLGHTSVTSMGATTINGDLGVFPGTSLPAVGTVTLDPRASRHAGDAVAAQAAADAAAAYADLAGRACGTTLPAPGGVYTGSTLAAPGVYCFDSADVRLTGTTTLSGSGLYIFKVTGALTTDPSTQIVYSAGSTTDTCKGSYVFWRVGGASATLGASNAFVGTLLAQNAISLGASTTVDGRVISTDGSIAMNANTITACMAGKTFGTLTPIKVTGGGGIEVQGPGRQDFANYGFNAHPGAAGAPATGSFNYVNHTQGPPPYHLVGTVTDVDVVTAMTDGSAQTVRFSGTCTRVADCTFSAMVQDNGEPGRDDRFGVTIVIDGEVVEEQSMRQVRNGNIQFHTSTLTTDVNSTSLQGGQTLRLSARLRRDRTVATPADAYVVLRMPGGQLLSWTGNALVPGLVPIVRNFIPVDFDGTLLQLQVPLGTPAGTYTWMSALTDAGTLNLRSGIAERSFTIRP